MTRSELLQAFKRLPARERLEVIEAAIHSFREDFQTEKQTAQKHQLARAAQALLRDYRENGELTLFTALDGETFHE